MKPAPRTVGELAALVNARCEGDPGREVSGVADLGDAGPNDLAFCTGGRWAEVLAQTQAGAVFVDKLQPPAGVVALRHPSPRYAFAVAARALLPQAWPQPGIHASACVDASAVVAGATVDAFAVVEADVVLEPGVWVQAHAFVGAGVRVGAGSRLMPHAVVLEGSVLKQRVCVYPGAVVGADGFGVAPGPDGLVRMPHLGHVTVEADVEIGANSCVDRAALGETRIGRGTRLDNLVQVAHGVRVGAECLLAAFSGLAGRARLGDRVWMGGRAAVTEGVEVGAGARLAALSSASKAVAPGAKMGGSPARVFRDWQRELVALRRLPRLLATLERRGDKESSS